jgi:hypothetical protein
MKFFVGIVVVFLSIQPIFGQHVLFGERNRLLHENNLFFDKEGFLYPEIFISDSSLASANNSLRLWYQSNILVTDSLLNHYGIRHHSSSIDNQVAIQLNDSLVSEKARFFSTNYNALNFVIHGFRKNFNETGIDVSSVTEFQLFNEEIERYHSEFESISVYWDGLYDCCFSLNSKKNKQLFRLFEEASLQASNVGQQLHRLIAKTAVKNITLIGHSLGAKVAIQLHPASISNKTIHLCLIAPALSAAAIKELYEKLPQTADIRWLIVYNEADFVLKKKDNKMGLFGPGATKYGPTGLGCNYRNELSQLFATIQKNHPLVSFKLVNKTSIGKCHSLRCYTRDENLKEVSQFITGND